MILNTAISIIVCTLYCIATQSFGALLLRLVAPRYYAAKDEDRIASFAGSFLLGVGTLAAIWQLVGLAGWFSLPVIIAVLVVVFLAGVRFFVPIWAGFGQLLRKGIGDLRRDSPILLGAYFLTVVLVLMTGVMTINPPQPRGDALAFYMALPKAMAASHRLQPLPGYEAFSEFSFQGEMHYAALISLSGGVAAKMLLWPMALAVSAMLVAIGSKVGLGRRGRWFTLAALFTSTAFTNLIWDGKVDLFSTGMGLAAVLWSLEVGERRDGETIRLLGLVTGFAIVAKITFVVVMVPGLLLIMIWRLQLQHDQEAYFSRVFLSKLVVNGFWFAIWMLIPLLPHLIKNAVLFGEPLAPLVSSSRSGVVQRAWLAPETTRKILLTYPVSLVYGRFWGQSGQLSPLLLAFLPLAALLPRPASLRRSVMVQVAVFGLVGIASWHLFFPSGFAPRYVMPSVLVFLLPGAFGAERALDRFSKYPLLAVAVAITLFAALLIGYSGLIDLTKTGLLRVVGRVTLCEMEEYNADATCRIAEKLNEETASEDRVFFAANYRYWFRPSIIQCANTTEEFAEYSLIPTADAHWRYLFESGYRYIVIDEITHGSFLESLDLDQTPEWLNVSIIYNDWPYTVYRLESIEPAGHPRLICAQVNPPAWEVISIDE